MADEEKRNEKRLARRYRRHVLRERPRYVGWWWAPPESIEQMRGMIDVFRDNIEDTLERIFPSVPLFPGLKQPRVDILDLGDAFQVVADMPGVQKEDFNIDLTPERVEINAESSKETERKGEEYTYRERGYASYRRVLDLPADVLPDKAEASFKNGVLELNLPKKEPTEVEKKTRVEIK